MGENHLGRLFAASLLLVVLAAAPHVLVTLALVEGRTFAQPEWLFWLSGSAQVLATIGATAAVAKSIIRYREFRGVLACLALLCFGGVNYLVAMPKAAHLGGVDLATALAPEWMALHWWLVLYASLPWLVLEIAVAALAAATSVAARDEESRADLARERDEAEIRAARLESELARRIETTREETEDLRTMLDKLRETVAGLNPERQKLVRFSKNERRAQVVALLEEHGEALTVEQVAAAMGLAGSSIRNDLNALACEGGPLRKLTGRPARYSVEPAREAA